MPQVTLRINGYSYTIGCKDGEESHLEAMGAEVSSRIDGVRLAAGPSGESRMLVMAALLMADDIFELRRKLEAATPAEVQPKPDPKLSRKLSRMAKRAEEIAEGLEVPGAP
jgi:cell division protein ZapA